MLAFTSLRCWIQLDISDPVGLLLFLRRCVRLVIDIMAYNGREDLSDRLLNIEYMIGIHKMNNRILHILVPKFALMCCSLFITWVSSDQCYVEANWRDICWMKKTQSLWRLVISECMPKRNTEKRGRCGKHERGVSMALSRYFVVY